MKKCCRTETVKTKRRSVFRARATRTSAHAPAYRPAVVHVTYHIVWCQRSHVCYESCHKLCCQLQNVQCELRHLSTHLVASMVPVCLLMWFPRICATPVRCVLHFYRIYTLIVRIHAAMFFEALAGHCDAPALHNYCLPAVAPGVSLASIRVLITPWRLIDNHTPVECNTCRCGLCITFFSCGASQI